MAAYFDGEDFCLPQSSNSTSSGLSTPSNPDSASNSSIDASPASPCTGFAHTEVASMYTAAAQSPEAYLLVPMVLPVDALASIYSQVIGGAQGVRREQHAALQGNGLDQITGSVWRLSQDPNGSR